MTFITALARPHATLVAVYPAVYLPCIMLRDSLAKSAPLVMIIVCNLHNAVPFSNQVSDEGLLVLVSGRQRHVRLVQTTSLTRKDVPSIKLEDIKGELDFEGFLVLRC